MKRILTENLRLALQIAIEETSKREKARNGPDFESGSVSGWKEIVAAIDKRELIIVNDK